MALIKPIPTGATSNYCVSGYKKSNLNTSTSPTVIPLGTDFSNGFSVSNNAITVEKAGTYNLKTYLELYTGQSGTYPISIRVNGNAVYTLSEYTQVGLQFTYTIDQNITVSAGDVITLTVDSLAFAANPIEIYYLGITA